MKLSRKHLLFSLIIITIAVFLVSYELPYYVYKPGHTEKLDGIVTVENGYESEGDFRLVTVSGAQATPMAMLWSKVLKFHDLVPLKEARPDGMSDEEYMHGQLHLMESSQHASTVVAYKAANKKVEIDHLGVNVMSVVKNMPAYHKLNVGDIIFAIDGMEVFEAEELTSYVETKKEGDVIELDIYREGELITEKIELTTFPDNREKIGIGIQLATERIVDVDPPIKFDSGKIGGPSAGLMFSLEIYNQLIEEDITKGYNICGTGEVDFDGNVLRIGGVDKKVVAAHKQGCHVFFVPNEDGREDSNYMVAKYVSDLIETEMEIIPIDHFNEALNYLNRLD